MPNIASILKEEISRVSRKEVRGETQALKKSSAQYRSDIAALKRRLQALERLVTRLAKGAGVTKASKEPADGPPSDVQRFSAKGMAGVRKRLNISAAEAGVLLGVSALSVYNWEGGKARPRATHLPAIGKLRKLSKSQAREALESGKPL